MSHETNLEKLQEKKKRNKIRRADFIRLWAENVESTPDKEWSRQQNKIINSQLKAAREVRTKEDYSK